MTWIDVRSLTIYSARTGAGGTTIVTSPVATPLPAAAWNLSGDLADSSQ
jgi:hypothetical protein